MRSLFIVLFVMLSSVLSVAQAADPIAITAKLRNSHYQVRINTWGDKTGNISMGGSIDLELTNEKGEIVEQHLVLNQSYNKQIFDASGRNYDVLISMGDSLKTLGGMSGFVALLTQLSGKAASAPAMDVNVNFVMALINSRGQVVLVDSARLAVATR